LRQFSHQFFASLKKIHSESPRVLSSAEEKNCKIKKMVLKPVFGRLIAINFALFIADSLYFNSKSCWKDKIGQMVSFFSQWSSQLEQKFLSIKLGTCNLMMTKSKS
jgi:hypothetical protein